MTTSVYRLGVVVLLLTLSLTAVAERQPVLPQIDVPHDYYYREMYLPQLTTGPSALTWSPDAQTLIYSMQGSLWRQPLGSTVAEQLTAAEGAYDYQPDWSPDGRRVVFTRYDGSAMELMLLDLSTGSVVPLTRGGDVNVEPRFAPDGKRIAFVSTRDTGRFHIRIGSLGPEFESEPLQPARQSAVPRYYYSRWDHQLSPSWSPDGKAIAYVGNPEVPYGTGSIRVQRLDGDTEPVLVQREETSWKARPDWAPDSPRLVYASYLGRSWHQLWVTRVGGAAEPFPLTYGDFDITAPRWSPDGSRIGYVSNAGGNLAIRIQEWVGGATTILETTERRYLEPVGELVIDVTDDKGRAVPVRLAVVGADGRAHAPASRWMHADDGFDRELMDSEAHYFHSDGPATLTVPAGPASVTVWHGLEHAVLQRSVEVLANRENRLSLRLARLDLPPPLQNLASGDVHVHMNYGGSYRNTPAHLARQARAEDLDVVFNLIVNKEQRIPDIGYFSPKPDVASTADVLIAHAQEYHTSFWGHLGLLGLSSHLLIPDYAAYPETAAASLYPDNATIAELAREQGALVGYVHPFYAPPPDPASDAGLTHALPVDAALGLVDYYEVVGFSDHRASAEVWYRLMNCGLRIAAAGGTDAMANYASLRGPLGLNRTYVRGDAAGYVPGSATGYMPGSAAGYMPGSAAGYMPGSAAGAKPAARQAAWLQALAAGRSMATNGPLLWLTADDRGPGEELVLPAGGGEVRYRGTLRSIVPVDRLEVVLNGEVVQSVRLSGDRQSADFDGAIRVPHSGWLLVRAVNDTAHPLIFDQYPYATTTPVWLSVGGEPARSRDAADYFLAWIGRMREAAAAHPDYNNPAERRRVLERLDRAQQVFEACRAR